jgi:hypothetical protein
MFLIFFAFASCRKHDLAKSDGGGDNVADSHQIYDKGDIDNTSRGGYARWVTNLQDVSGGWSSQDGAYKIKVEMRVLSVQQRGNDNDLDLREFLLGETMDFISGGGLYKVYYDSRAPREMRLIKTNRDDGSLSSVYLFRDGDIQPGSKIELK